jgi:hypothetical protein
MNTISKHTGLSFAISVLFLAGASLHAQNDGSDNPTNAALEAAAIIISNTVAQLSEMTATNDVNSNGVALAEQGESTNAVIETNLPTSGPNLQPGPKESRRDFLIRMRAGNPDTNEPGKAGDNLQANAAADSLFRPVKPEYITFRLITERNIFDPNRVPRRGNRTPVKLKTLESFALVGLMSYEKGTFAFFDGSSSDYRKAVKLADSIAGYKVTNIDGNTIKLASGTNQVELRVGMQLRREEGGGWVASTQSEAYASDSSAPTAAAHSDSPSTGADSDVLERLRKRRDQE